MKRKILLSVFLLIVALSGNSQFVTKPLNYQVSGDYYSPYYYSIVDEDQVWLGTKHNSISGANTYTYAVHTTDGGDTWIFDSIPVPGQPNICNVSAVDASTVFYVFVDNWYNGSVWKTTDGGATWTQKTTNQFQGGFADFYHAFNAGEGVAVGDPNGGYFEIYTTADGGDSWSRTGSSDIPAPRPGEMGLTDGFSSVGDNIWFASNMGRCFKSTDQGHQWTVSAVAEIYGQFDVAFSSLQYGVFFDYGPPGTKIFYKTADGGTTWTADSLSDNDMIGHMSSVGGFDGGFVIATYNPTTYLTNVYFTPDFFANIVVLDSNLWAVPMGLSFKDATTGWLCGGGRDTNAIFKYTGILTSIFNAANAPEKLSIMPNPSSADAIVKLPGSLDSKALQLRVVDMSGKELEKQCIVSSTGWTKLNGSGYANGVYIVQIITGDQVIASERWVVYH
jgi:photosystem II stability/assembly factor-like uncharacterized protein